MNSQGRLHRGARSIAFWTGAAVLACLLAAGVMLWLVFKTEMASLRERLEGRSALVPTSRADVEYAAKGSGTPVLVIHGSGGGFDQGLEMVGLLADHGFRLIAPSRFGYLRSTYPDDASPELQADILAEFLDAIGEKKVAVFGGSAGALSALQFAIRHPDRCSALVAMVPASYAPTREPNTGPLEHPVSNFLVVRALQSDFLFWLAITIAPRVMTRMILATEPATVTSAGAAEEARVANVLKHILPVSVRTKGLLLDMRTAGAPPPYRLEQIACPVLAISAEDDLYGTADSARYLASQVRRGTLLLYATGGHILAGRSESTWNAVARFLATPD